MISVPTLLYQQKKTLETTEMSTTEKMGGEIWTICETGWNKGSALGRKDEFGLEHAEFKALVGHPGCDILKQAE